MVIWNDSLECEIVLFEKYWSFLGDTKVFLSFSLFGVSAFFKVFDRFSLMLSEGDLGSDWNLSKIERWDLACTISTRILLRIHSLNIFWTNYYSLVLSLIRISMIHLSLYT